MKYETPGWCQYLKIDNNLWVEEGGQLSQRQAANQSNIKLPLPLHCWTKVSENLHSLSSPWRGWWWSALPLRWKTTLSKLALRLRWKASFMHWGSFFLGTFGHNGWVGLTHGEGFRICFLFSEIFPEHKIGGAWVVRGLSESTGGASNPVFFDNANKLKNTQKCIKNIY